MKTASSNLRFMSLLTLAALIAVLSSPVGSADEPTPAPTKSAKTDSVIEAEADPWQGEFNLFTTRLAEKYPDEFAEAVLTKDQYRGWIGFKAGVPAGVADGVEKLGRTDLVGDVGYTDQEVDAASEAALDTVKSLLGKSSGIGSHRESESMRVINVLYDGIAIDSDALEVNPPWLAANQKFNLK